MEKFSKWRDGGTGVAPFLPVASGYSGKSSIVVASEMLLSTVAGVIKLPLALAALLLHLVFAWTPLGRVTLRLLLWVSGVYSIKLVEERKVVTHPEAGDLIVSNYTSPLDPLACATLFDCTFVLPHEGLFSEVSLLTALNNALSFPKPRPSDSLEKIVDKAKKNGKVVVLFAEGTTSNGRGLLPIPEIPISLLPHATLYPSAIKYNPATVITATPTNFLVWVATLLGHISGVSVSVKLGTRVAATGDDRAVTKEIGENICRVGRIRRVGDYLNADAKKEFVVAWNRYHR